MSDSVYVNGNKTEGPQAATSLRTLFENAGVVSPPAEAGTAPAKEQAEGSVADAAESGNGSANGGAKRADDSGSADEELLEQLREQQRQKGGEAPLYVCATLGPAENAEWDKLNSGNRLETTDDGRSCL